MIANRKIEIEKIAISILNKYRINNNPGSHLKEIAEAEKISLVEFDEWPDNTCGRLTHIDGHPTIYFNAKHGKEMQAFTIAHELGHYYLNHLKNREAEIICIDRDLEYYEEDEYFKELEVEANYFAACLLLPLHLITPVFHEFLKHRGRAFPLYVDSQPCNYTDYKYCISHIKSKFLASESAIRYRLINLNYLTYNFEKKGRKSKQGLMSISEIFQAIAEGSIE